MQKQSNKQRTNLSRRAIAFVLACAAATAALTVSAARAAEENEQRGFGMTTGVVGIVQGQTARLTVWNKGDQAILARLQFVDTQGQVLFLCNSFIPPGKSAAMDWPCCGGNGRIDLQAQFGTNAKKSIGLLMPTLQITDGTSNATQWMIGQEGFTEFRPLFNPPLVAPW